MVEGTVYRDSDGLMLCLLARRLSLQSVARKRGTYHIAALRKAQTKAMLPWVMASAIGVLPSLSFTYGLASRERSAAVACPSSMMAAQCNGIRLWSSGQLIVFARQAKYSATSERLSMIA